MATLEQIAAALAKADAAGNVEDARALAAAYRQMQAQATPGAPKTGAQLAEEMNLPLPDTPMTPPVEPEPSMVPWLDPATAFANAAIDSVPVAGPTLTNMRQNADAVFHSLITGEPYDFDKSWQQQAGFDADISRAHPEASTVGAVAGSVGPLIALGMTPKGGQALGMTGPLGQRMVAGGVSGGLIAGADALARGDDFGEAGMKGLMGFGLGTAFPLAERALSPIARMIMGKSVPKSTQSIGRQLEREGIEPSTLMQRIDELGPDAVLADLGPNLQRQAGAIASLPGEGQAILRDALVKRQQGSNARIQGDVDTALGPAPVPSFVQSDIRAGQDALDPAYRQVLQGANPVDTTSLASWLDDVAFRDRGPAQTAAQKVRQMLDETGNAGTLSADPETLLATRKAIDGMMDAEANTSVLGVLGRARREVDEMLASSVPGIKEVDAQFAELARQNKAVDAGQQMLESGRTAPRPAEAADMMAAGAQPEGLLVGPSGAAFRLTQGARAEIDRIIGTTGNNLTALKGALKGDGSWNRDRLVTLFGKDKADRLLGVLEREQRYAQTFDTVTRNSETAARTAAQKEAAPREFGQPGVTLADLLLKIPQGAANMGARARSEATNKAIAEMLMGKPTPEMVDQLLFARQMNRGLIGSAPVPLITSQ